MCYQVFILFEKGGNLFLKRVFEIPVSDGKRKAMAIEIFFCFLPHGWEYFYDRIKDPVWAYFVPCCSFHI